MPWFWVVATKVCETQSNVAVVGFHVAHDMERSRIIPCEDSQRRKKDSWCICVNEVHRDEQVKMKDEIEEHGIQDERWMP